MNNTNFPDHEEINFFKGQYIAFCVIIFLILFGVIINCFQEIFVSKISFRDILKELIKEKTDSFYFVLLAILPIFCIFYGPIIFTFQVSLSENFEKGCISFLVSHVYTNLFYPTLLVLLAIKIDLKKYFYLSKIRKPVEYTVVQKIGDKNNKYFFWIGTIFFILSFGLYFQRLFISECDENILFIERIIYIILMLGSYLIFNLKFSFKKYLIVPYHTTSEDYFILFFITFNIFIISCLALCLQILSANKYISREIFYSVLLYASFLHPITFVLNIFYFDKNDFQANINEYIDQEKLNLNCRKNYDLEKLKSEIRNWKIVEKSQKQKNAERFNN